jgi:hypothetical protein
MDASTTAGKDGVYLELYELQYRYSESGLDSPEQI